MERAIQDLTVPVNADLDQHERRFARRRKRIVELEESSLELSDPDDALIGCVKSDLALLQSAAMQCCSPQLHKGTTTPEELAPIIPAMGAAIRLAKMQVAVFQITSQRDKNPRRREEAAEREADVAAINIDSPRDQENLSSASAAGISDHQAE